ncbi:MAG: TetR/AcrR family transcriptional regulator [Erythrobacter sp.]|nr:MAG: TetR/AcrR family transcriptional regulator [Erythrobacter sp.]
MSTTLGPETEALATNAISTKPLQGRSLASYERMLDATKALMLERGSEDFTLQDVSDLGAVSIGSIYLRFQSKDRLLHAVIARELEDVIATEEAMVAEVLQDQQDLRTFLTRFIDRYSRNLEEHARILRAIMQRASVDPAVSGPGKETARRSMTMAVDAILQFKDEIAGSDPREKAHAVMQIVFATIARQFGLGSTPESGDEDVWEVMQKELAKMAYAYLRYAE